MQKIAKIHEDEHYVVVGSNFYRFAIYNKTDNEIWTAQFRNSAKDPVLWAESTQMALIEEYSHLSPDGKEYFKKMRANPHLLELHAIYKEKKDLQEIESTLRKFILDSGRFSGGVGNFFVAPKPISHESLLWCIKRKEESSPDFEEQFKEYMQRQEKLDDLVKKFEDKLKVN